MVPILLRPVYYMGAPFASLPHFPSTGEPITRWMNRDDAFLNVVQGLQAVIQEILQERLEGAQKELGDIEERIDTLGVSYVKAQVSLRSLANKEEALEEEQLGIEEEMRALQRRLKEVQKQKAALSQERRGVEGERELVESKAVEAYEEESRLKQVGLEIRKQIEKIKQQ